MSILEYALDVNKDVSLIIELCKELGIKKQNEDDFLMQKIRQATDLQKQKMECISPKEYLLTELQKRENIRFRENNIIPDSFPPTNTN